MTDSIPPSSGIYKITCTANQKIYIGSAVDLRHRKQQHWSELRHNKHHNTILQNAWNKYGEQTFVFEVLEQVLLMSLTAREQYWFKKLKPFGNKGFNIAREAGSTLGKKHTPEELEKMRLSHIGKLLGKKLSPEHVEKVRQANFGRKHTPADIEKMRQSHLGKKLPPEQIEKIKSYKHTPEAIEKIRQSRLGKKFSPKSIEKMRQSALTRKARKSDD